MAKSAQQIKVNDPISERVGLAVEAALEKKALNLDVLQVGAITSIGDYFIICSGNTERQTQAIADGIDGTLRESLHVRPLLIEGTTPGRWILMDYGDFIVHIFTEDCRRFYGLERLWGDAPNVTSQFVPSESRATRNER
jgi:ribosome-associated protein